MSKSVRGLKSYVFRCDVAYDWDIDLKDIERDTKLYLEDHLLLPERRYARFGEFSACPQTPTNHDDQSFKNYADQLKNFWFRQQYVRGMHVEASYTATAHLWLLRQMVQADKWIFTTDEDASLERAVRTIFGEEIRSGKADHFIQRIDDKKCISQARREYWLAQRELRRWGKSQGMSTLGSSWRYAHSKLVKELLPGFRFAEDHRVGGRTVKKPNPKSYLTMPRAHYNYGNYDVKAATDVSRYDPDRLACMLLSVSLRATDAFANQIRRRLSYLERPLVTARSSDGKSYMYANGNPMYAQWALTVLRTYYNFCLPWKYRGQRKGLTPAQRLGIAKRVYDMEDILYFK